MKRTTCFLNGKIIPLAKAAINPYDLGFLRGFGAFDVMRAAKGEPVFLAAHLKRLRQSLKLLDLALPMSDTDFEDTVRMLLKKNKFDDAFIRTAVTGGVGPDTMTPGDTPTILIMIEERTGYPETHFTKGVKVITLPHARHLPLAKTPNYVEPIRNAGLRRRKGAVEIIYLHDGHALEASTSNFFIVKDGTLVTPEEGILHGITRATVLAVAKKLKLPIERRRITEAELRSADECFLTATGKEVLPVVMIDTKKIGDGNVGSVTKRLLGGYRDAVTSSLGISKAPVKRSAR